MYRLIVALTLVLMGAALNGAIGAELELRLTDSTTGEAVADAIVITDTGPGEDPRRAEIVQKNREFQPHTLVIPRGSRVDFPNQDSTQHHVYSFSPTKIFNLELYAGRPEQPVVFDRAGVVEIGCNIHDQMQAFILVTDVRPSGRTDQQGQLTLRLPPPGSSNGESAIRVWHPRMTDNTRMARFPLTQPYPGQLDIAVELAPETTGDDPLDSLQQRFREI